MLQETEEVSAAFKHKHRIQLCALDPSQAVLLVAFQGGVVQLFSVFSGAVLFNKSAEETLNLETEVTAVAWFNDQCSYWFALACWEGQVAFFFHPQEKKGREFLKCRKVQSLHKRDVVTLDATQKNLLVTGSADNLVCFWNTFNCQINKQVPLTSLSP
jgi:WD40 repeat protein